MKTTEIQDALLTEYHSLRPLALTNYSGVTGYEADVIMISNSGFSYEYEIKTSRADFKKDFSKISKHKHLQNPTIKPGKYSRNYPYAPNYFYYVCVEGLIKPSEVPKYAGLIYIVNNIPKVIVKGKRLHTHKVPDKILKAVARVLSIRTVFGSSFLRYKHGSK